MNSFTDSEKISSRRRFLTRAGSGLGGLALLQLLDSTASTATSRRNPLAAKLSHHQPKAKSVIWLFMEGGPSHLDLFDPKPALERLAGQPMPESFGKPITAMGTGSNTIMPAKRKWAQHGQSGTWVSDWYPHIAKHADDLAVIRSCWAEGLNHVGSVCQMNTGAIIAGRPSLGAWLTYGLGTANENLPTFVILTDSKSVVGGAQNWSSGFLPATYQGTLLQREGPPILHLKRPERISDAQQRGMLDLLLDVNRHHAAGHSSEEELDARMESYELAYRMQTAAPDAVDLSVESELTKKLYGLDDPATEPFGKNCLMARRLVERGVRFVELYCGSGSGWDAHQDMEGNHSKWCKASDRPIAGLLEDLKARGLLEDTLVVWGGEFGRTPFNEKGDGRDHNPWGFTMWMAGGGIKAGQTIGTTDEIGLRAVDKPYHVHDIHATILHLLGLDHHRLTFLHNGRAERATINGGNLIAELL
jgi:Protein of unknown function (DUF1501)